MPDFGKAALSLLQGKWAGKTWNVIGDSITEHNGKTTKNYHDYIKDKIQCIVNNNGISGTGYLIDQTPGTTSDAFYKRINSMSTADLITIFGGTNDWGRVENTLPIGANTDIGYLFRNILQSIVTVTNCTFTYTSNILNVSVPTTGGFAQCFVSRKKLEFKVLNSYYVIVSEDATNYYYVGILGGDTGKYKSFNKTTFAAADVLTGLFTGTAANDNLKVEIVADKCNVYKVNGNSYTLLASFTYTGTSNLGFLISPTASGNVADFSDLSITPTTFYSAADYVLGTLVNKYPSKTIAAFTPLPRNYNLRQEGPTNTRGETLQQYADAIIQVANRYAIPVLDLFRNSGLYPNNNTVVSTYMPDGLHPNDAGHQRIADKILAFINTL